jgi:uncharacterized damage-inducible protein DinB
MSQNLFIASRLREVFLSGTWIANTNFKAQLSDLDWAQATQKVGDLNTIADLTFHINYYLEGLIAVFDGGKLTISDKFSFDYPPIQSELEWREMVDNFLKNAKKFANQVENLPNSQFSQPFVDEKYGTYLRNIEGVLEHSYYHLGQIVLIKKMIGTV